MNWHWTVFKLWWRLTLIYCSKFGIHWGSSVPSLSWPRWLSLPVFWTCHSLSLSLSVSMSKLADLGWTRPLERLLSWWGRFCRNKMLKVSVLLKHMNKTNCEMWELLQSRGSAVAVPVTKESCMHWTWLNSCVTVTKVVLCYYVSGCVHAFQWSLTLFAMDIDLGLALDWQTLPGHVQHLWLSDFQRQDPQPINWIFSKFSWVERLKFNSLDSAFSGLLRVMSVNICTWSPGSSAHEFMLLMASWDLHRYRY